MEACLTVNFWNRILNARQLLNALSLGLSFGRAGAADEAQLPPVAQVQADYARDIKPIFESQCYSCHGPKKQKGELRLDLKLPAMKGGVSGAVIVPGKSAESILIQNVSRIKDA